MILLVALVLVVASVPLTGKSLVGVRDVRLRAVHYVVAALGLQILIINVIPEVLPGVVAAVLHLLSYGLAAWFVVANRHVRGLCLIGIGGLCNLTAIAANGGVMPASPTAAAAAGLPAGDGFVNSAADATARLWFLGDVFAVPRPVPLANVFSIGDLILLAGAAVCLHSLATRVVRSRPFELRGDSDLADAAHAFLAAGRGRLVRAG